jgi:single-strand DNA-binding protein
MNAIEAAFEGRIGQAPELRTTKGGKPWCSLSVGVSGEGDGDAVTWIGVAVFGSAAETVAKLDKGARVYVEGRLRLDAWTDREGRERHGLKVNAWRVEVLGQIGHRKPRKPRQEAGEGQGGPDATAMRDWQRPAATAAGGDPRGI